MTTAERLSSLDAGQLSETDAIILIRQLTNALPGDGFGVSLAGARSERGWTAGTERLTRLFALLAKSEDPSAGSALLAFMHYSRVPWNRDSTFANTAVEAVLCAPTEDIEAHRILGLLNTSHPEILVPSLRHVTRHLVKRLAVLNSIISASKRTDPDVVEAAIACLGRLVHDSESVACSGAYNVLSTHSHSGSGADNAQLFEDVLPIIQATLRELLDTAPNTIGKRKSSGYFDDRKRSDIFRGAAEVVRKELLRLLLASGDDSCHELIISSDLKLADKFELVSDVQTPATLVAYFVDSLRGHPVETYNAVVCGGNRLFIQLAAYAETRVLLKAEIDNSSTANEEYRIIVSMCLAWLRDPAGLPGVFENLFRRGKVLDRRLYDEVVPALLPNGKQSRIIAQCACEASSPTSWWSADGEEVLGEDYSRMRESTRLLCKIKNPTTSNLLTLIATRDTRSERSGWGPFWEEQREIANRELRKRGSPAYVSAAFTEYREQGVWSTLRSLLRRPVG